MLLTLTTTHAPATDLGYLLGKNPAKLQTFALTFGRAHVFYPVVSDARCTAALFVEVDPVRLARRGDGGEGSAPLEPYVNDRPYAASSFLSVAIAQVFGSAFGGKSRERQELADAALPFEACIESLACRGGRALVERLFRPLGYAVETERHALDPAFPAWGDSAYQRVRLTGTVRLADLLSHLYVLVPVIDDEKHYWVGDDEVEKLLRKGEGWLATHPERAFIAQRYLRHQRDLVKSALARLTLDEGTNLAERDAQAAAGEEAVEKKVRLDEARLAAVVDTLRALGAASVVDLGCGEGKLLRALLADKRVTRILGVDVSLRALAIAERRLRLAELAPKQAERIALAQGSVTYRDTRFEGFDAAALVEVIEHLDASRLSALERVVFRHAHPRAVLVTTPNAEYNALFESLPAGRMRHADHRFEWTRAEFSRWAERVADASGYAVRFAAIGPEHVDFGAPTQMAVFTS